MTLVVVGGVGVMLGIRGVQGMFTNGVVGCRCPCMDGCVCQARSLTGMTSFSSSGPRGRRCTGVGKLRGLVVGANGRPFR